jgi:hypothetical protein
MPHIACSQLLYLFYYFHQPPAFCFAEGAAFHDFYYVADAALVFLVMRMELGSLLHEFSIDGVLNFTLYSHGNGLIHFVAAYHADPGFTKISGFHLDIFFLELESDY